MYDLLGLVNIGPKLDGLLQWIFILAVLNVNCFSYRLIDENKYQI